jgi:hypothetical protein
MSENIDNTTNIIFSIYLGDYFTIKSFGLIKEDINNKDIIFTPDGITKLNEDLKNIKKDTLNIQIKGFFQNMKNNTTIELNRLKELKNYINIAFQFDVENLEQKITENSLTHVTFLNFFKNYNDLIIKDYRYKFIVLDTYFSERKDTYFRELHSFFADNDERKKCVYNFAQNYISPSNQDIEYIYSYIETFIDCVNQNMKLKANANARAANARAANARASENEKLLQIIEFLNKKEDFNFEMDDFEPINLDEIKITRSLFEKIIEEILNKCKNYEKNERVKEKKCVFYDHYNYRIGNIDGINTSTKYKMIIDILLSTLNDTNNILKNLDSGDIDFYNKHFEDIHYYIDSAKKYTKGKEYEKIIKYYVDLIKNKKSFEDEDIDHINEYKNSVENEKREGGGINKWICTKNKKIINGKEKSLWRNSKTGELRFKKMVNKKGKIYATYVKS